MPILHNLVDDHPFPMMEDDVLAMAQSCDQTFHYSWQIRIANYGLLAQQVSSRDSDFRKRVEREFFVELPEGFVDQLTQKIESVGYEHFPRNFEGVLETFPSWTFLMFCRSNGRLKKCIRSTGDDCDGEQGVLIQRFIELWDLIHLHAPFPDNSIEGERSKRQQKMDARRQRRDEKKRGGAT